MIFIDLKQSQPNQNWFDLVNTHDQNLKDQNTTAQATTPTGQKREVFDLSTENGRKGYYDALKELWNNEKINLKATFFQKAELSGRKCWFSEADSIGAALEIEHFRPKGGVDVLDYTKYINPKTWQKIGSPIDAQIARKEGYYWLTYDWTNYRLSAKIPNSQKRCYFPLLQNSQPAKQHSEENNEFPLLLDPLKEEDCNLISFEKNKNKVIAIPSADLEEWVNGYSYDDDDDTEEIDEQTKINYLRAAISIAIYKLNDMEGIKEARAKVWIEVEKLCNDLLAAQESSKKDAIVKELNKKIQPAADYAAVARQVVNRFYNRGEITIEEYNKITQINTK